MVTLHDQAGASDLKMAKHLQVLQLIYANCCTGTLGDLRKSRGWMDGFPTLERLMVAQRRAITAKRFGAPGPQSSLSLGGALRWDATSSG